MFITDRHRHCARRSLRDQITAIARQFRPATSFGFTAADLRVYVGLTAKELKAGGFTVDEIKHAGFAPHLLKACMT